MKRLMGGLVLSGALLVGSGELTPLQPIAGSAMAADRTVVLTVEALQGRSPSCAVIVYRALAAVDGVGAVDISTRTGTAIVIYNDAMTDIADIVRATAEVGFPSEAAE